MLAKTIPAGVLAAVALATTGTAVPTAVAAEDNTVPIIRHAWVRTVVLGPAARTPVTVHVRVGDESGVAGVEAWLHSADGLDGAEIPRFERVPDRRDVYRGTVDLTKTAKPGVWKVDFFVTDNADNMALRRDRATFEIKRHTKFSGFDAGPEPIRRGATLSLTGRLLRFDVDRGYLNYGRRTVQVEFRRAGRTRWRTTASVTANRYGVVRHRVKATADGTWRLRFLGHWAHTPAASAGDWVNVR